MHMTYLASEEGGFGCGGAGQLLLPSCQGEDQISLREKLGANARIWAKLTNLS